MVVVCRMGGEQIILFAIFLIFYNVIPVEELETREYLIFSKCESNGWSCVNQRGTLDVLYQCTNETGWEVAVGELPLNLPRKAQSLTIQNCQEVKLTFEKFPDYTLRFLAIKNIGNLTVTPTTTNFSLPQRIIFENINSILSLRSFTFIGNIESITFHNVRIMHIASEGFYHLKIRKTIRWDGVKIGLLDMNALNDIQVNGEFLITNSHLDTLDMQSFQVKAPKVVIENSHIKDVRFYAIVVLADQFFLTNNTGFDLVMPNAFGVLAREVVIKGNSFNYLQTEALQQITPALWNEEIKGKITYTFQNNHIQVADFGSLHVNLLEYATAKATMMLGNNTFSCSCTHLGWLGLEFFEHADDFHKRLLSAEENNTCIDAPCYLPLSIMEMLVKSANICATNHTTEELCELYQQKLKKHVDNSGTYLYNNFVAIFLVKLVLILVYP
ncbi:uncharacterized protein [Anabrus simplex]|uniref:uncharacterized protein n=1 Tax=Anabrus simplex TaxID=316456 RepID=UPI0035A3B989